MHILTQSAMVAVTFLFISSLKMLFVESGQNLKVDPRT